MALTTSGVNIVRDLNETNKNENADIEEAYNSLVYIRSSFDNWDSGSAIGEEVMGNYDLMIKALEAYLTEASNVYTAIANYVETQESINLGN